MSNIEKKEMKSVQEKRIKEMTHMAEKRKIKAMEAEKETRKADHTEKRKMQNLRGNCITMKKVSNGSNKSEISLGKKKW